MLVIRKEQMAALAADLDRRMEERLYALVREQHPTIVAELGEAGARARFRAGLEQAQVWGLDRWYDIAFAVDLFFRHGSLEAPGIASLREILERPDLPGGQRVGLAEIALERRAAEDAFEETAVEPALEEGTT
jgi:hypothetical protein